MKNGNVSILDVIENLVMKKEMKGVNDAMTGQHRPRFSLNSQLSSRMSNQTNNTSLQKELGPRSHFSRS